MMFLAGFIVGGLVFTACAFVMFLLTDQPSEVVKALTIQPTHPKLRASVILPKTDVQLARDAAEQRAKDLGLDGLPVEDVL